MLVFDVARLLRRLTTQYDPREDRLRVSGELSGGVTVVLWLTQRLASTLLSHLCGWLESSSAASKEVESPGYQTLVQNFEQQRALRELQLEQPVFAEFPLECWLIESIDLATGDAAVRLEFKAAGRVAVALALSNIQLRQWLTILLDQYRKADWCWQGWPEWMQEDLPARGGWATASLH